MSQGSELIAALKRCLRAKGLVYRDLAKALDLSEASVKRLLTRGDLSLARLETICGLLDMTVYDLARIASASAERRSSTLTLAQEQALATDARLLTCFYLLLNGWTPAQISKTYDLAGPVLTKRLAALDKLNLIELGVDNRVRLLTHRKIAWRKDGPVRKTYENRVKQEFLDATFDGEQQCLVFETGELSPPAMAIMQRKIDKLAKEFIELAELDLHLPDAEKTGVGLLIGFRPWIFSVFAEQYLSRDDRT